MYNPFTLEGKKILVTGASSGIGRTIAIECSKMGAEVIITARNEARLAATLKEMEGDGGKCILADLTKEEELDVLIENLPELDGIVCNAGIVKSLVTQFIEKQDTTEIFEVNVFGNISLISKLLQSKKIKKKASVVFISSVTGLCSTYIGGSLYGATKAALQGFSKSLALELSSRGIRVNVVNPAMVDTDLLDGSSISKEQLEMDANRYPFKRYGKPEEVAWAAIYLLSDATEWMTGSNILLDGGLTLQ